MVSVRVFDFRSEGQSRSQQFTTPSQIIDLGEKIFQVRYRETFEREHPGKFVAINVSDESATIGDCPSSALLQAKRINLKVSFTCSVSDTRVPLRPG